MKRSIFRTAVSAAVCLAVLSMSAGAAVLFSPPEPGTTTERPFEKGTAGSNSFRIPGLNTLRDGTLLATADARWNTTYDGGGLDTITSRSEDNGANWRYTFANYLGDNGNQYSGSGSTCFIDPSVAVAYDPTTGVETIYLLVDLQAGGCALNGSGNLWPSTEKGFDDQGRLLLSTDTYGDETGGNNKTYMYDYYLDGSTIKRKADNTPVQGITVDGHFNVVGTYNNQEVRSNLFFKDSPFKVQRTSYLYLVTSTDGGESWSDPTLLPLKRAGERAYLSAPSRGLVTKDGDIVFPCYSFSTNGGVFHQYVSFIYSKDGENWTRSENAPAPTGTPQKSDSESVAVELSDGRLRFFARNNYSARLSYLDFIPGSGGLSNGTWKNRVDTSLVTSSNCQISAIKHSHTSGGKDVLLVSCPTGPNGKGATDSSAEKRRNGKIFVGRVNNDANKTMEWVEKAHITVSKQAEEYFMYSAMTELT